HHYITSGRRKDTPREDRLGGLTPPGERSDEGDDHLPFVSPPRRQWVRTERPLGEGARLETHWHKSSVTRAGPLTRAWVALNLTSPGESDHGQVRSREGVQELEEMAGGHLPG